tara:strand:- start:1991 stop:2437 length:447 start_codon:yes stop_codon:yes gene_type:complete
MVLILCGCSSQNLMNLTMGSTKIHKFEGKYVSKGQFKGEDIVYIVIFFPTGIARPDDAIENTLRENNLDYLTNINIQKESFYFPYIGGYNKYVVTGEGWVRSDDIDVEVEENFETDYSNESNLKYDPQTGLPIKPIKYDPETGDPIYE